MKHFLISFTVFLVWSFFGLWLYSTFKTDNRISSATIELIKPTNSDVTPNIPTEANVSIDKALSEHAIEETIHKKDSSSFNKTKTSLEGLKAINFNGDIVFSFNEGVSISENNSAVFIPEAVLNFKYKVKTYLKEHQNKKVQINSIYSASENSVYPNIGVQRGLKIKEILLSAGVASDKVVIKSVIKDIEFNKEGIFKNSVLIRFKEIDEKRIKKLKPVLPESIDVYPEFSHAGIQVNQNVKVLLHDLKEIIKEYPEIKIELIGHTDHIGSDIDNFETALNYAKQMEYYLVNKGGINRSRIKYSSKGETEPLVGSGGNIMANRRITVVFY